ncbi:TIGR03936 family radical SAM-associated protein [Candidatus Soleaferrea massiliensis]|uniref:TIGR03936 family radical SAM-associated protein n=1 Tax=Candidatus Soleaferrea massiliensis TaxID=1470354 RepID=UPI000693F89E|nr:TIGR03936 family radical SAM-associated protein [Candidatus Soleaferrea massiliensis]
MHNIRVFYNKTQRAKYISHLDINRCMQRALKRSGLPVWFTEGFHTHIYVTFALPTPLGFESMYEVMDFRLVEELPMKEVVRRLNEHLPQGIEIWGAGAPVMKPERIKYAEYDLSLTYLDKTGAETGAHLEEFMEQESIIVTKKTKKKVKEIDLKPLVSVLHTEVCGDTLKLTIRTNAGILLNVNPMLFLEAFESRYGLRSDYWKITKKKVLDENLKDFV